MKISTRIFLASVCTAALTLASGAANSGGGGHGGGGGHSVFQHNQHSGNANSGANTTGAAKRPKSAAQPKGTVVRDHGDKSTKTTTTTSCSGHGHHGGGCATVRDHTNGQQGDWHTPPRGPSGPAGGPNSRKPPS